jgi:hypothetical protein
MNDIELYKSRVIQSAYNNKIAIRDDALANISVILETPAVAAADKLEVQLSRLLDANMHITQIESVFGASPTAAEEEDLCETKD